MTTKLMNTKKNNNFKEENSEIVSEFKTTSIIPT